MNKVLLFTPMFNCEKQITRVLDQMTDDIAEQISEWIIINNRSTDDGESVVIDYLKNKNLPLRVSLLRNNENYGLGGSHKVAFDYAKKNSFDYVIVFHGDDQGNIADLLPYLKSNEYVNFDCFLGARFMKGSTLEGYSLFRTFGNKVYDCLFSVVCGYPIYDLGSGLNVYKTSILENNFYFKYKDNLVFNYCMILGSSYYKHRTCFFPITWRETDQVSNVRMVSQAITVLKLLASYFFNKHKFVHKELRDFIVKNYSAVLVYKNWGSNVE